ncbi:glucose-6-phosphate dehydrogenase assembly protein OpcA [Nocardioides caldifontis]|uniref:glucose-6-phosphate dehydrogenase assembly protein OpcA n=1 Tax=Nocardioides caldifontis TaxID=2588938 RepID=UPI0011E005BC|nr:glucose-6-phosphate dehydrogenase assembly protein OpcA [Nocardioides caldifontis]
MSILEDTDAAAVAAAFVDARRAAGSPAMDMVMTMVIVVPEDVAEDALHAARDASKEHPSRRLGVILGSKRGPSRIDADIKAGSGTTGERALMRLTGEVVEHPESVVLPLLLPDSPVVVWWPTAAPEDPASDPLGRLGSRRITDAAQAPRARSKALLTQCHSYAPGNTDLAWTRITPWRALLATAMDDVEEKVRAISVSAEHVSPSADLLGAWLTDRLKAPVTRKRSRGPGITEVVLTTRSGDIRVSRKDGRLATLSVPGQPDRPVALRRRGIVELLTEELRRLDPDDVYAATVRRLRRDAARSQGAG